MSAYDKRAYDKRELMISALLAQLSQNFRLTERTSRRADAVQTRA